MTEKELKEKLISVYRAFREFNLVREKAYQFKQTVSYARASKLSDEPKIECVGNGTENGIISSLAYDEEVHKAFAKYIDAKHSAELIINLLSDSKEKELMTRRYILFQSWSKIRTEMNYSKRHAFRIHESALTNILERWHQMAPNGT